MLHVCRIPLRWADMDAKAHVNNVQYMRLLEQSRIEWMGNTVDHPEWGDGVSLVSVHQSCDFRLETVYPAEVEVRLYLVKLGRSSVTLHQDIRTVGDERVRAEGTAVLVFTQASGGSIPIPEAARLLFQPRVTA